jgi:hypothetical protein
MFKCGGFGMIRQLMGHEGIKDLLPSYCHPTWLKILSQKKWMTKIHNVAKIKQEIWKT